MSVQSFQAISATFAESVKSTDASGAIQEIVDGYGIIALSSINYSATIVQIHE